MFCRLMGGHGLYNYLLREAAKSESQLYIYLLAAPRRSAEHQFNPLAFLRTLFWQRTKQNYPDEELYLPQF
jgi:hypothetical protein